MQKKRQCSLTCHLAANREAKEGGVVRPCAQERQPESLAGKWAAANVKGKLSLCVPQCSPL